MIAVIKNRDSKDWSVKARLVAQDLKRLKAVRLLIAVVMGADFLSTCDLVTAYLQGKKLKGNQGIALKFLNPKTGEWVYWRLDGYTLYGCIEAAKIGTRPYQSF